jgi:ATP-binding cassette subfamily F protein 3
MRIALAKLLLAQPNLLLLDEPTNHLDIEARSWLESFLAAYPHSVILVSHDRHFLDAVVHKITEVSPQGLLDFTGGYSRYVILREEHHQRVAAHNRRIREEVARLTDLADRFGAKATKAAQAQGWRKQAEKLQEDLIPEIPPRDTIHFRFPPAPHSGKTVLTLEGVEKHYGEKLVFSGVNLVVNRGERVALVGVNGAGKSTLMRILAGQERHQGAVRPGHMVQPSFFAQDQARVLDPNKTVHEEAMHDAPYEVVPKLRSLLGAFLFSGDSVEKPVRVLSGGERNRLALVKLLLRPANLLLLDEPTNHLDLDSKDVLLEALQQFEGTVVFVSHDRYFLEQLATKVVEVGDGKAETYPSNYADYLWKKGQTSTAPGSAPAANQPEIAAPSPEINQDKAARIADREAKKAQERERRQQEKRVAEVEAKIAAVEAEVAALEKALSDPETYKNGDETVRLTRELAEKKQALEDLMNQWEEAQTALTV